MCAGNCQGDCGCSASVPRGDRGFPGVAGATPVISIGPTTTLPPGTQSQVVQTGTVLNPVFSFAIEQGATGPIGAPGVGTNGTNGDNAWARSLLPYTQPIVGGTTTLLCSNTSFMEVGLPIWVQTGGSYRVVSITPISVVIENLGYPLNAAPGAVILADSLFQPLIVAQGERGQPGLNGSSGSSGAAALIQIVNTIPTTAPTPGQELVVYQNDPVTATIFRAYQWDGVSAWIAGANFAGAPGTDILAASGNPQVNFPGYPIGTLAFRNDTGDLYKKTSADPAPWSLQFGTASTFEQVAAKSSNMLGTEPLTTPKIIGDIPLPATHTAAGTYSFDLQYSNVSVNLDNNITLNYSNANYTNSAHWLWQLSNVSGSSKTIAYTPGAFNKKTGLTLPSTIAASSTIHYMCVKDTLTSKLTIIEAYVVVAV